MAKRKAAARKSSAGRGSRKAAKKTRAGGRKTRKSARKATARKSAARKASRKGAARKRSASRPARKTARKTARKSAKSARTSSRKSARATSTRRAGTGRAASRAKTKKTVPTRSAPALNRPRRTVDDDLEQTPPSSLDLDRHASMARSGRRELKEKLDEHTETSPAMTGGDIDADWESAYSVGDEAPGGDNPTPDQDIVDDIGRAVGVEYEDNEELKGEAKVTSRDKHRWELDPASSEDYNDR